MPAFDNIIEFLIKCRAFAAAPLKTMSSFKLVTYSPPLFCLMAKTMPAERYSLVPDKNSLCSLIGALQPLFHPIAQFKTV